MIKRKIVYLSILANIFCISKGFSADENPASPDRLAENCSSINHLKLYPRDRNNINLLLSSNTQLNSLDLQYCEVGQDISILTSLTNLTNLTISNTNLRDKVQVLASLTNLRKLDLSENGLHPRHIKYLIPLKNLEHFVSLGNNLEGERGCLKQAFTKDTHLTVSDSGI